MSEQLASSAAVYSSECLSMPAGSSGTASVVLLPDTRGSQLLQPRAGLWVCTRKLESEHIMGYDLGQAVARI